MATFFDIANETLKKAIVAFKKDHAANLRTDLDTLTRALDSVLMVNSDSRYGAAFIPGNKRKDWPQFDIYRVVIVDGATRKKIVLDLAGILVPSTWRYPCGLFSGDGQPAQIMNIEMLEQFFIGAYLTLPESPVIKLVADV